jgi:transcriptional regulator with XRE-family HTH domain
LGQHLPASEKRRGYQEKNLAERSRCKVEVIEALEEGKLSPSLAPLLQIARGLGVHLGALLADKTIRRSCHYQKYKQRESCCSIFWNSYCIRFQTLEFQPLAYNKAGRHMEPFVIDVHPTVSEDCMFSIHEGEEFIYVLTGKIQISYGPDVYILSPGDSIYYDSTTPHEVRAVVKKMDE